MRNIFTILLSILFLLIYNYAQAQKEYAKNSVNKLLEFKDKTYENTFRTILLYPLAQLENQLHRQLLSPSIKLGTFDPLFLEFDNLGEKYETFRAKIYHCDAYWQKSPLSEVEYLNEYNDYSIPDYKLSYATKTPYIHYTFEVPKTKISGNFVLVIYRDENPKDIVISKRFMVYEQKIGIQSKINYSSDIAKRQTHQQVDFELDYRQFSLRDPQQDLKVFIRQNQRFDQIKSGFRPSNINESEQKIYFNFFELENNFWGGNEFRFFDTRSVRSKRVNVDRIEYDADQTKVWLRYDIPQSNKAYIETDDFDGNLIIDQYETNQGGNESDYLRITFTLKTENKTGFDVYVNGKFNNWAIDLNNMMTYSEEKGAYQATLELKQGIYNYNYVVKNKNTGVINENLIEGSHAQTKNTYEIFVYHKQPAGRADLLVGYQLIN